MAACALVFGNLLSMLSVRFLFFGLMCLRPLAVVVTSVGNQCWRVFLCGGFSCSGKEGPG